MRKLFSKVLGLSMMASAVLTSCEDEFTEEQALEKQKEILEALNTADNANAIALSELNAEQQMAYQMYQDSLERIGPVVNYSVTVLAAGSVNTNARTNGEAFAPGAEVTVVQGGVAITETAGDNGVAVFDDLRIGQAIVTVTATDHTTVTYTTSLGSSSYELTEDNITTTIPIFPTTIAGGASEVSGIVYAQLDATTEEAEVVEGAVVRSTISVGDALDDYGIYYGSTSKGEIKTASYSNFTQLATTDAEGKYSLIIPNGLGDDGEGIESRIEILPFEGEQTFLAEQGDTLALVTKKVKFDLNSVGNGGDHIDANLPGVFAVVSAPTGNTATGFALDAAPSPTEITYSNLRLVNGGSGYTVGDIFVFSNGVSVDYAYVHVNNVDANGRITSVSMADNGAEYTSSPGVPTAATADDITDLGFGQVPSGSGASFDLQFQVYYNIFVSNGGSGYSFFPDVSVTVQDYENLGGGDVLTTVADENINNGWGNLDGFSTYTFNSYAYVNNGVIVANAANGDTLDLVGPFASKPSFDVKPIEMRTAKILPEDIIVNDQGEITDIDDFDDYGSGYASAPTVTFKSVSGEGSGAVVVLEMYYGEVDGWTFTNGGTGYLDQVNFKNTSPQNVYNTQSYYSYEYFKSGTSTTNYNFNYQFGQILE